MDQVGCLLSEDCAAGLSCDTSLPQPTCRDDNECDPAGPHGHVGAAHCGNHTTCTNTAGSFTCGCESDRYTDFQAKVGCRDKDECTEVRHEGPTRQVIVRHIKSYLVRAATTATAWPTVPTPTVAGIVPASRAIRGCPRLR